MWKLTQRIITTGMKGMTTKDTGDSQTPSFHQTVLLDRLSSIFRTGGKITTTSNSEGGNPFLIKSDQSNVEILYPFHCRKTR